MHHAQGVEGGSKRVEGVARLPPIPIPRRMLNFPETRGLSLVFPNVVPFARGAMGAPVDGPPSPFGHATVRRGSIAPFVLMRGTVSSGPHGPVEQFLLSQWL